MLLAQGNLRLGLWPSLLTVGDSFKKKKKRVYQFSIFRILSKIWLKNSSQFSDTDQMEKEIGIVNRYLTILCYQNSSNHSVLHLMWHKHTQMELYTYSKVYFLQVICQLSPWNMNNWPCYTLFCFCGGCAGNVFITISLKSCFLYYLIVFSGSVESVIHNSCGRESRNACWR